MGDHLGLHSSDVLSSDKKTPDAAIASRWALLSNRFNLRDQPFLLYKFESHLAEGSSDAAPRSVFYRRPKNDLYIRILDGLQETSSMEFVRYHCYSRATRSRWLIESPLV